LAKRAVDTALETFVILLMAAMVLDVTWQVFTRFVLHHPSSWTEEVANFLLIWIGLVGSALALSRKAHLGIDYFVGKLAPRPQVLTRIVVFTLTLFFSTAILGIGGLRLVIKTLMTNQISPATQVKIGYIYLALPISSLFMIYYSSLFIYQSIQDWRRL